MITRDDGLKALARYGARGSRRKWWAFEGFTSVDCFLETDSLIVLIEGKRTEGVSAATDWFIRRNQIVRNVEVARSLARGKDFAVLVCAEGKIELTDQDWTNSLPHLSLPEVDILKEHYLGWTTWSAVASRLCPGLALPDRLDDAVTLCQSFR